ncbi:hypothetical protein LLG34_02890 [bacterium]|nr:hypothetical protein [bacterium]
MEKEPSLCGYYREDIDYFTKILTAITFFDYIYIFLKWDLFSFFADLEYLE